MADFDLLPPSGHLLRCVLRLRMWVVVWLGVPSSLQFDCCLPGYVPGGVGVGGPLLVPGVGGLEALAFGGQLGGEGGCAGRASEVMLGAGVGFSLCGEPELAAYAGRGGGAGTLALKGSCFEFAAV